MRLVLDTNVVLSSRSARSRTAMNKHLLGLGGHYNGIPIVTPAQAVQQIQEKRGG